MAPASRRCRKRPEHRRDAGATLRNYPRFAPEIFGKVSCNTIPPPRIIFAGSGEFGSPPLRMLVEKGYQIVQVFTQPDRPAGRGKKLTPTPIAQLGEELERPVVRTLDVNSETMPPADVLVVIAFGQ